MDQKKLHQLGKRSETAARAIAMLAGRRRNAKYTAIAGFKADLKKKDGKPINSVELNHVFDGLEELGVGKVKRSKRGKIRGFTWKVKPTELARILTGEAFVEPKVEEPRGLARKAPITLVILRKNRPPQMVQTNEAAIRNLG